MDWFRRPRAEAAKPVPVAPVAEPAADPPEPALPRVQIVPPPPPVSPTDEAPEPVRPPPAPVPYPGLRTSQRVVLHLYAQGRIAPGDVAPFGLTQAGIGEALQLTQSGLAKTLGRLVEGGVLTVGRRHVEHQDRRLKVYELTPLGESIVRDLRRRRNGAPASGSSRPPPSIRLAP